MNEDYQSPQAALIAEQLRHTIDLLRADLEKIQAEQAHLAEMNGHRLAHLEADALDHEIRIRGLQEGVTTFKVWSGLASGGSSLMALIALFKAFFGV